MATVAFAEPGKTYPARVDINANLHPAQLEALERGRAGGPLTLELALEGAIFRKAASPVETFEGRLSYDLKPADWIEVLEHWRYAEGFLLQVPKFANPDSAAAIRATSDLEKAIGEMADGDYRASVAACRDAPETAYGAEDADLFPGLGYKAPTGLRAAEKAERFWLVRRGLWAVTHAAKHKDEVTRSIEWDRRDARAAIFMLSALLEQDPPV